jgi:Tol biopolymer transport system component
VRKRSIGIRAALLAGVVAFGVASPAARAEGSSACGVGGRLATVNESYDGIDVVDAATGAQRTVAYEPAGLVKAGMITAPSWSPDGQWLAYGRTAYAATVATSTQIRIVAPNGDRRATVVTVRAAGATSEVAWSPDGKRIAFVVWTQNRPIELATWTPFGDRTTIFVVNRDGTGLKPVLSLTATLVSELAWAPDGRHLAFANGVAATTIDVVDVDAVVRLARAVTPRTINAFGPRWSPDGGHLAFLANPVARVLDAPQVWVSDRTGKHASALPLSSWDVPTWSPDSRWVAAAGWRAGIAAANIDTREIRQITHDRDDRAAAWSPDGGRLAFIRPVNGSDRGTIWAVDSHGGVARPVSHPGGYIAPVWCPAS